MRGKERRLREVSLRPRKSLAQRLPIECSLVRRKWPCPGTTEPSLSGGLPKENITAGKQWKPKGVNSWKLSANHIPYGWVISPSLKGFWGMHTCPCLLHIPGMSPCHVRRQLWYRGSSLTDRKRKVLLRGKVSVKRSVKAGGSERSVTCDVIAPVWREILGGAKCYVEKTKS